MTIYRRPRGHDLNREISPELPHQIVREMAKGAPEARRVLERMRGAGLDPGKLFLRRSTFHLGAHYANGAFYLDKRSDAFRGEWRIQTRANAEEVMQMYPPGGYGDFEICLRTDADQFEVLLSNGRPLRPVLRLQFDLTDMPPLVRRNHSLAHLIEMGQVSCVFLDAH